MHSLARLKTTLIAVAMAKNLFEKINGPKPRIGILAVLSLWETATSKGLSY